MRVSLTVLILASTSAAQNFLPASGWQATTVHATRLTKQAPDFVRFNPY